MKGTTHALVGGLIGALVGAPAPAAVGGVISHGLLDLVPHDDEPALPLILLDGVGAAAVLAVGLLTGNAGVAAGAIGGALPDLENVPDIVLHRRLPKVFPSHWEDHQPPPAGTRRVEPFVACTAVVGLAFLLYRTWAAGVLR